MADTMTMTESNNIAPSLTLTQRAELAHLVSSRWHQSTTDLQTISQDSEEAWDYYLHNKPGVGARSVDPTRKTYGTSKLSRQPGLRLGVIPKAVDSMLAFQHNATFPADDRFFRGIPQNKLSAETKVQEVFERHLANNFAESNVVEAFRQFRLSQIIDGTAAMRIKYKRKKRKKRVYEPTTITLPFDLGELPVGKPKSKKKEVVEWEGTVGEVLDFDDWRVDTTASSMEDTWFAVRWYEEAFKIEEDYPWVDKDRIGPYEKVHEAYSQNEKRESYGLPPLTQSINPEHEPEGKKKALLMACYDDFEVDGKIYKNHVCVVLNDVDVVFFGENDFDHGRIPYIVAPYMPVPGQIYGMSGIHHAIPSSEAIDKAISNILLTSTWAAKPVFKFRVTDSALRKWADKHQDVEPGMKLPMRDLSSLQQLDINLVNMSVLQSVIERAELNVQDVTGASPFISGEPPDKSEVTAFEIDQRVQGGNSRYQSTMAHWNNTVLEPFMFMVMENERQFRENSLLVDGIELRPEQIKLLDYKFTITSTQATLTRNKQLANLRTLLFEVAPTLAQSGLAQPVDGQVGLKLVEIMKRFLITGGLSDVDNLIEAIQQQPQQLPITPQGGIEGGLPSVPPSPNDGAITPTDPGG